MDNLNKSEQNKSYYQKNRERLLEKAKSRTKVKEDQSEQVVPLFRKAPTQPTRGSKTPKSSHRWVDFLGSGLLTFLVFIISGYLFYETARYFFTAEKSLLGACVKALILEGSAIAFSLSPARNRLETFFNGLMVILIYSFGIWAISYPVLSSFQLQNTQADIHQKTLAELEQEIAKKTSVRDRYWNQDRAILAKRYDQSLSDLGNRLEAERARVLEVPSARLVHGLLIAGIIFRILAMISNFACIQALRRRGRPVHIRG